MKKTNKRITKVAKPTRVKKAAKKPTTKTAKKRLTKAKSTTKSVVVKKSATKKSVIKKPAMKSAIKLATKPMSIKSTPKKTISKSATKKQVGAPAQIDSQYNVILNHLVKNGSINTMEAIKSYNVLRLGAVIFNLRQGGMVIKTGVHVFTNKNGRKSNIAKYVLQA